MPNTVNLPTPPTINLERLSMGELEKIRRDVATSLVLQTFARYEGLERQSLEQRWAEADRLYSGYKPTEYWEGSTVPKNSWPYRVVFDQVESALPAMREALFGTEDFFDAVPLPGGNLQAARDTKARLKYVLGQQRGGYGPSAKTETMEAVKNQLVYGQGILGIEFNPASKLPEVTSWDPRDVYFDYANNTPWVDNCRSIITRRFKTVEELEKWRGAEGITLPSSDELWSMAQNRSYAQADSAKDETRSIIGEYGTVAGDKIPNPRHGLVEVLTYYSNERIIVVLGRTKCAFNEANPYECIPFAVFPCYTYPNRFVAQSYADILYELQRVIEGLVNGRLDEITLNLNPPRAMTQDNYMTPSEEAFRPGAAWHFKNPKEDLIIPPVASIGTNVWNEVEFHEKSAEKRSGLNGIAQGSARPGNVNRTAGGVSSQMQASALRISTLVYNVETYGIVPLLTKLVKFLRVHEAPGGFAQAKTAEGFGYVSTSSYYQPVTFTIKGSSQMLSRERLQQILPMLIQNLANGQMVQGLAQAKMTIDWTEFFRLLQDASGTAENYALVRQMNEQELAAMNQPPPQVVAAQQKAQLDTQRALQITQMNNQTDLQIESMKSQGDPMEMQREQAKLQLEVQKAQIDMAVKERELEYKQREAELKLQMKRMEMEQKAQQAQLEQILGTQKANLDLRLNAQRGELDARNAEREYERSEAEHGFAMRSMEERSALERKLNTDKMSLSAQRLRAIKERPQGAKAAKPKE